MSQESPVSILFDVGGDPLASADGAALPTSGLMVTGTDGSVARFMGVDSSGRVKVVGAGSAGSPAGGVVSIQGVTSGTPVSVTGTVTATNSSVGALGSTVPTDGSFISGSDGTNLQGLRVFDLDTGGGSEYNLGISIRLPGNGGSVVGGTSSNPLRTDPTGTTTQPVSASALPLPTGASTEATLAGVLTTTAFQARINTLGQKNSANSTPVVLASDQPAIQVTPAPSTTGTLSNVSASTSSVTLLAANSDRKGAMVVNDSTKTCYVKFGATASSTDFSALLRAGDYYEVPFGYTGRIDAVWAAVNGAARVTELT